MPETKAKNTTAEDDRFLKENEDELSRSTQTAKWVHSPDEHEDRPGQTLATRSHEVIQAWAKQRGGEPATVPGTDHDGHAGVLRLNFPGYGGQNLETISWDDWFRSFDERRLVFLFQEHKADGSESNFFRLDSPDREDG